VEHFINKDHNKWFSVLLVLIGLWIPVVINLSGVKNMGAGQAVTSVIKFAVLAFMSTVGLFFISRANFTPWNVSKESTVAAIGGGMAIALFSYIGVETVAVAAAKVRNPDRNIPRATVLGTLAVAVVYLLSLTAVFGGRADRGGSAVPAGQHRTLRHVLRRPQLRQLWATQLVLIVGGLLLPACLLFALATT
jgi:basic amino acid/polyamine antiporter, APA family